MGLAVRYFYIASLYKEYPKMLKSEQTIEDIKKALLDPDFGKEKSPWITAQNFIITTIINNSNGLGATENRIDLFKNSGGGIVAQSGISNQINSQLLF